MTKKGFSKSPTAFTYLKSTIIFDNLGSHIVHKKLQISPNNFAIDYFVVYTYPPMAAYITLQALSLVKLLISSNEEKRETAIKLLTQAIDQMKTT